MILRSEAHLEASRKAQVLVREAPRPRRSRIGWAIFWGLILLNEIRGAYVVKQAWQAMFG